MRKQQGWRYKVEGYGEEFISTIGRFGVGFEDESVEEHECLVEGPLSNLKQSL
ncbi:hypothetical protein Drorol1_Dr00019063 [Drosera rotundifolia]